MTVVSVSGAIDPQGQARFAQFSVTFTGASGLGLHGTSTTAFTVSGGQVLIRYMSGKVTTTLTGASGTLVLGVTGSTTLFIGTTTATLMTTSAELWVSATPTAAGIALPAALTNIVIDANILIGSNNGAADVTGGVLQLDVVWEPLTLGATLS